MPRCLGLGTRCLFGLAWLLLFVAGLMHEAAAANRPGGAKAQAEAQPAPPAGPQTGALWAGRTPPAVPEPLRPWVPWVLHENDDARCPRSWVGDDAGVTICTWPARLRLELRDKGGGFVMTVRTFTERAVKLPGNGKHWPQDVRADGYPAVVLSDDGTTDDDVPPVVHLKPGLHTLSGTFQWEELPESLAAPKDVGLLTLVVKGNAVLHPNRDEDGQVFFAKRRRGRQRRRARRARPGGASQNRRRCAAENVDTTVAAGFGQAARNLV